MTRKQRLVAVIYPGQVAIFEADHQITHDQANEFMTRMRARGVESILVSGCNLTRICNPRPWKRPR